MQRNFRTLIWRKNDRILALRGEVSKAVEGARVEKRVGHSLDAAVTISAPESLYQLLGPYREELRSILIVSQANLVQDQDLPGCERCWVHDPAVGRLADHPTICPRCRQALAASGL